MPSFERMGKNHGNGGKAQGGGGAGSGNGHPVVKKSPEAAAPRGHVVLPPPDPKFDGVIGTT